LQQEQVRLSQAFFFQLDKIAYQPFSFGVYSYPRLSFPLYLFTDRYNKIKEL
jgi:hypothetical protein